MTVKKAVAKKATKKPPAAGKIQKGDVYGCRVCGLAVKVDEVCGCLDFCDIICCDVPMNKKRA